MAYIGNTPAEAFSSFQKQDFTTSATTSYTLDHPVSNQNEIALFINFVRQEPTAAYTASGTTLTLTSATSSSDDMYCVYLGKAVQTVNPASGSVGSSQVASTIITGQTAETSIATDDTVLIHDTSAGALRKMTRANFVSGIGGTNTPAFHAYVSGNQSIANSTFQTVIFNVEYFDSASAYNVSDGKFTVPSGQAGKYLFTFNLRAGAWEAPRFITVFAKNGTDVSYFEHAAADSNERVSKGGSIIMDLSVSDYITIKLYQTSGSAQNITGVSNQSSNFFTGMKLVE